MIDQRLLPNPPYRQNGHDTCAVAAYATAVTPFVEPGSTSIFPNLLSEIMSYGVAQRFEQRDNPVDFYDAHAKNLLANFQRTNPNKSMIHWFEHLRSQKIGNTFTKIARDCQLTHVDSVEELSDRLKATGEATACIGYAYDATAQPPPAHFLMAWYDPATDRFLIRDSDQGGTVDVQEMRLRLAVQGAALFRERIPVSMWGTVITKVQPTPAVPETVAPA